MTHPRIFSRASQKLRHLHAFASSFDWFIELSVSLVTGQSTTLVLFIFYDTQLKTPLKPRRQVGSTPRSIVIPTDGMLVHRRVTPSILKAVPIVR